MPNIYVRPTALSNVCGRVDYVSNHKRQENLIATYSNVDQEFWKELAVHCQKMAKEAGAKKACEGREWHAALPNIYAQMYSGREEELAKDISDLFKQITETENFVAIHWNKTMTNFHVHVIVSENKEVDDVVFGAVLTRDTYYDANDKRSTKKACTDEKGNLLPGCSLHPKGFRRTYAKRFGTKENLRDPEINKKIKEALAEKFNRDLQTDRFRVFKEDGVHLKTQKVGKGLPEDLKEKIEKKNEVVHEWNNTVDELLCAADEVGKEAYEKSLNSILNAKKDVGKYRMTEHWIKAALFHIGKLKEKIGFLVQKISNKNQKNRPTSLQERLEAIKNERKENGHSKTPKTRNGPDMSH